MKIKDIPVKSSGPEKALRSRWKDFRLFTWFVIILNVALAVYNFWRPYIDSGISVPRITSVQSNSLLSKAHPKQMSVSPEAQVIITELIKRLKTIPPAEKFPNRLTPETPKKQLSPSFVSNTNGKHFNWDTEMRGNFLVIHNYIPADSRPPSSKHSVTLTTHGTLEFLHHIIQLCQRWEGHLSVAVYAPGEDLKAAVDVVLHMRQCGDVCVRKNVSWHFIYDKEYGPKPSEIIPPELIARKHSLNCSVPWMTSDYRRKHKLPYPINVLRNVARLQAHTHYVLSSDIELYPSGKMVSMFEKFIANYEKSGVRRVYALPIFEVQAGLEVPTNKSDLVQMMNNGTAIFFHKWICDGCQKFPERDKWMKQIPKEDTIEVFKVTKRNRKFNFWEPIYIGTNDEPLYDERLTWEGKLDKMSQMYELCLLDYDVWILDNAFLVHSPGIKYFSVQDHQRRIPYMGKNKAIHSKILATLRKKYPGTKNVC